MAQSSRLLTHEKKVVVVFFLSLTMIHKKDVNVV